MADVNGRRIRRRRRHILYAAAAAALLQLTRVDAATFPELYSVTVPADRTQPNVRADAIERGMRILLSRVTGRRDAGVNAELQSLIAGAQSYLTSYAELDRERIRVGFNGARVSGALTSLDWPVWGAERPSTLLWIAIDFGDGQRALLSEQAPPDVLSSERAGLFDSIREDLLRAADERGLPVILPLLDLEDFQAISFAEVWGGFDSLIERASERYGADAELVGRIALTEIGLDVRWTLIQGGRSRAMRSSSLREGIDWVADQYAAEFSIVGGARLTRIDILGVESLREYGRVMSYLESVSILETIDVERLADDVLTLRVAARGDDRVLERVLTLGGVLELAEARGSAFDFGPALTFRTARRDPPQP